MHREGLKGELIYLYFTESVISGQDEFTGGFQPDTRVPRAVDVRTPVPDLSGNHWQHMLYHHPSGK